MASDVSSNYCCGVCGSRVNKPAVITVRSFEMERADVYEIGLCTEHAQEVTCVCCNKKFRPAKGNMALTGDLGEGGPVCKSCYVDDKAEECMVCDDLYQAKDMTSHDDGGDEYRCCLGCKEMMEDE